MSFRDKLISLRRNEFLRSVSILVGGTAFSQAVTILALPLLTRLYTPSDFSVLAVYVSLTGIISVAACLRLDIAVPIPKHDEEAADVLALALASALLIAGILGLLAWCFPEQIISLLRQPKLKPYLWMVPLGILFASGYSALGFWATRKNNYSGLARNRIGQAICGTGTQVGLGHIAPFGLLFGQMINSGAGLFGLGFQAIRQDRQALTSISIAGMRRMFRLYDRFPKYSTFEALANSAGIQLPIIMIAALAAGPQAGFLMLAMRAMQAPMGLIGNAIAQVYLSRAPDEYRAGTLNHFSTRVLGGLMKTGVGPLIFAGIVAPNVFALIFGHEWRSAGLMVAWMTPWFVMQFLSSPVSMALHVTNNQRSALVLQLLGLVVRVGAVLIAASVNAACIVEAYAVSGFVFYCLYLTVIADRVSIKAADVIHELRKNTPVLLVWIGGAIVLKYAIAGIFF